MQARCNQYEAASVPRAISQTREVYERMCMHHLVKGRSVCSPSLLPPDPSAYIYLFSSNVCIYVSRHIYRYGCIDIYVSICIYYLYRYAAKF